MMKSRSFFPLLFLIFFVNILFRLIFVFYGYIATEEGTLIYNQHLAYQGLLPFIHYDAWNSLLNDYLIGWYQYLVTPTILSQRFFGLLLASLVFLVTLRIANIMGNNLITLLTALFITFGSYTYLYLSNIPYSEQTMTLLMMLSLLFLAKYCFNKKVHSFDGFLSLLFIALATITRVQAAPSAFILWFFLTFFCQKNLKERLITNGSVAALIVLIHLPFFLSSLDHLVYSYTWPLFADKVLIYQQNASGITLTSLWQFARGIFQNYGIFFILIPSALTASFYKIKSRRKKNCNSISSFMAILIILSGTFIITGLIHKPPYSSYIYPSVPMLSLLAAFLINQLFQSLHTSYRFLYMLVVILLINNFLLFPHYKFIKTSWRTSFKTPYQYLSEIANYINNTTKEGDEILSFYTPITVAAHRTIPLGLNRDRFSLTFLPTSEAKKYHLTTIDMLIEYIRSKKAAAIVFTDKNIQYFGINDQQRRLVLKHLNSHYILTNKFDQISQIESPNTNILFLYTRKNED